MKLAILLQFLAAVIYYTTGNVQITWLIAFVLFLNNLSLGILWKQLASVSNNSNLQLFNFNKIIFTTSLLILGFLIDLPLNPIKATTWQDLANDNEVLFSGLLLGVLWKDSLLTLEIKLSRFFRSDKN